MFEQPQSPSGRPSMEIIRKHFIRVVGYACCCIVFLMVYTNDGLRLLDILSFRSDSNLKSLGYLINTKGCHMPSWDPFDSSVNQFYQELDVPYLCSRKPSFLIVRPDATLQLDAVVLNNYYNVKTSSVLCTYQAIQRDPGTSDRPSDDNFTLSPSLNLTFGVALQTDFMYVKCASFGRQFHDEYLAVTPLKPIAEERSEKAALNTTHFDKLNVIVIGIDSISKLNFIRYFTRTSTFLRENLKAIELHGYNKVGDNTFPNLVPLLTGHFISHYWNESLKDMYFDKLDFVWKHYAAIGYRILLAEDAPEMATFNYLKSGFKDAPTDYYLRPFCLAVEDSEMRRRSKSHCFDHRMEMKVILDYLRSFVDTMENRPYFAFSFVARLTHDVLNYAAYADAPAHEILHHLYASNVTNNSLVIFMSDHGMRFGPARQTYIGKFEERWPIMFLSFPEWFTRKYPFIERNLRTNQKRLTTPFDVHATLLNVLDFVSGKTLVDNYAVNSESRGLSLFQEIPAERTCEQASILPHWCTCEKLESVSIRNLEVQESAKVLIITINHLLRNYSSLCAKLSLNVVKDAHLGQSHDGLLRYQVTRYGKESFGSPVSAPVDYLVTVTVRPSEAMFEGTVRYDPTKGLHKVSGEISRINRYDHQGDCIRDAELRKFCYCKKEILYA